MTRRLTLRVMILWQHPLRRHHVQIFAEALVQHVQVVTVGMRRGLPVINRKRLLRLSVVATVG